MSGFSTYLSQKIISATLGSAGGTGGANLVPPTAVYLALFTADPTDNPIAANEIVSGGGSGAWYGRKSIGAFQMPSGSGNSTNNINQVSFNAVTGSSVTVTHWAMWDAANGGNMLYSDSIGTPKTFNVGDVPVVNAAALVVTVD